MYEDMFPDPLETAHQSEDVAWIWSLDLGVGFVFIHVGLDSFGAECALHSMMYRPLACCGKHTLPRRRPCASRFT